VRRTKSWRISCCDWRGCGDMRKRQGQWRRKQSRSFEVSAACSVKSSNSYIDVLEMAKKTLREREPDCTHKRNSIDVCQRASASANVSCISRVSSSRNHQTRFKEMNWKMCSPKSHLLCNIISHLLAMQGRIVGMVSNARADTNKVRQNHHSGR
jgi:hypothetical protein